MTVRLNPHTNPFVTVHAPLLEALVRTASGIELMPVLLFCRRQLSKLSSGSVLRLCGSGAGSPLSMRSERFIELHKIRERYCSP
jgi:hypothetical protein